MKIWHTYASEHSSRVKIIGSFQSPKSAREAAALFNRLLDVRDRVQPANARWAAVQKLCKQGHLHNLIRADLADLFRFEHVLPAGTEIRVESENTNVQPLLKILMNYRARIEIVSGPSCSH